MAVLYNSALFRAQFPPYSDLLAFPDVLIQLYWNNAAAYMDFSCATIPSAQQTLAMNLMTAHLTFLNQVANSGQNTGLMQGATIDKVSVQLTPPPEVNQWQWWLNQSPYGQQLLALLQVNTVGGWFVGGRRLGIRR